VQVPSLLGFDPAAGFEAHADEMMVRGGRLLGLCAGAAAVLWWPLDLLIFAAWPQTLRAFAIFRAGVFVFCVGGALVLPRLGWARRRPAATMTGAIAAVLGWIAYWMSSTVDGGWNSLAFLYLAPFATTIVIVPLRQRVAAVSAVCAAVPVGWFLKPGSPLTPLNEFITLSYLAFAAGAALLIGHGAYLLLRTVHRQAAELDSQRQELAEAARDLGKRVAERTAALSELRKHAQAAREQERRALGRDLHDGLGQELVAMRLAVSMARQQAGDGEAREALEVVEEQAVAAQSALRGLLADFRAALLDELGLVPAVRAMALEVGHSAGIDVRFDAAELDGEVRAELGIALFRVAQEALNNVSRHAGAGRVAVRLGGDGQQVRLAVLDDGVGLPPGGPPEGRYGLEGMRERMELLGGTLSLGEGLEGRGVAVRASAPRTAPTEAWA
jgi:signal transduction histidine kinase